jgi:hypothetical protein
MIPLLPKLQPCISPDVLSLKLSQVRLLVFLTSSTIVSLGAKQNSLFPGTGWTVDVKHTVCPLLTLLHTPVYLTEIGTSLVCLLGPT